MTLTCHQLSQTETSQRPPFILATDKWRGGKEGKKTFFPSPSVYLIQFRVEKDEEEKVSLSVFSPILFHLIWSAGGGGGNESWREREK